MARLIAMLDRAIPTRLGSSEKSAGASWQEFTRLRATFESKPKVSYRNFAAGYRRLAKFGLIHWRPNCRTLLTVETWAEKYLLWLPMTGGLEFCCPGDTHPQRVPAGQAGVMPAIAETECRLEAGSQVLALVVPQTALIEGMEVLTGQTLIGRVAFERATMSAETGIGRLIREVLEFVVDLMCGPDSGYATPVISARLEEATVLAMLSGLPHSFTDVLAEQEGGIVPGSVRRVELYIHAHAGEDLGIQDIADAVGYSVRSIQLAFRRFRNTTPMAYLRRVRLECVYEELLNAQPATTIANVASNWRFPHHGRFSAEFRRMYGESPSDVLHRGRRR